MVITGNGINKNELIPGFRSIVMVEKYIVQSIMKRKASMVKIIPDDFCFQRLSNSSNPKISAGNKNI